MYGGTYMHICSHVCMYGGTSAYMLACMHVLRHICIYGRMYACMEAHMHLCSHVWMEEHMHPPVAVSCIHSAQLEGVSLRMGRHAAPPPPPAPPSARRDGSGRFMSVMSTAIWLKLTFPSFITLDTQHAQDTEFRFHNQWCRF
jgi:hypothetical protein